VDRAAVPPRIGQLIEHVLPGAVDDPLTAELGSWLLAAPRFESFVEAHRDKIRKKLRGASDPDGRADVRAELLVARLLVADRGMNVAFEAYGSTKGGPDFTATYRGQRPSNLEVTRPHRALEPADDRPILAKLHQLPPGTPNALLIAIEAPDAATLDVAGAVRGIRSRADARYDAFFAQRGFETTRRFYERFLRLGAVLVFAERAAPDARASAWLNPSARIAVPERALRACVAALRASSGS
jgi:hypothetical protein